MTSQGYRSERDYESDTGNSLMQYMASSKKEIILGKNRTSTKIKRNKSHLQFEDIQILITRLQVDDFLIPFEQI